jgi:hypothetical protein
MQRCAAWIRLRPSNLPFIGLFVRGVGNRRRVFFDHGLLPVVKATGENNQAYSGGNNGDDDTHVQSPQLRSGLGVPRPLP